MNEYPIALLISRDELEKVCKAYNIDMRKLLNRAKASTEKLTRRDIEELMKPKYQKFWKEYMKIYKNQAERLLERYEMLEEMLVKSQGSVIILQRIRGKESEPIDIDLLDFKDEIDAGIKTLIKKIDGKLGFYDVPDGIK